MLNIIKYNPYRILGVYSDASKMEILANAGKLKAFAKVKKSLSFPLDNQELLGEVERTETSIDSALSSIQNETEKIKYALFWFFRVSDEIKSAQSDIVLSLLRENYDLAISQAASLYAMHGREILSSLVYENSSLNPDGLRDIFLGALTAEVDFSQIILDKSVIPSDWYVSLKGQTEGNLLDQVKGVISDIRNSKTPESKYQIAISNINESGQKIEDSARSIDSNSQLYPVFDNYADELINCAVDYQRNSYDYYADKKAYILAQFANKIAQLTKTKTRCQENIEIFKENQSTLLPEAYASEAQRIRKLRVDYAKSEKTIASGKSFAQAASEILSIIKAKTASSKEYLSCSEDVVNDVLTVVIDQVNEAMHGSKDEQYETLAEAYEVTNYLGTFDMGIDFKTDRFDENAKTLKVMCLRRGIVKRTFTEMLRAEDSSGWQAALFIQIAAIIAGAIITDNGDVGGGALIGLFAGSLIWLCCWRDRCEDEMGDTLWGCISSFGCLSFFLMAGIFIYWITLKGVKCVINEIKEELQ